jgi:hypothetical protein
MGVQEDLRTFITKHKAEKGKIFTNTSIGLPKVSLFIILQKTHNFCFITYNLMI